MKACDIEERTASDHRRVVLETALVPDAASEILVGRPTIPERPVMTQMIERVDMCTAVRVHVNRVSAVAVLLVCLCATTG